MDWHFPLPAVIMSISSLLVLMAFAALWPKRHLRSMRYVLLLLAGSIIWCFGAVVEYGTSNITLGIWAAYIQTIGAVLLVASFFSFSMVHTGSAKWNARKVQIFIWGMMALSILAIISDPYHHLFWPQIRATGSTPYIREFQKGILYWGLSLYNYALILLGICLLLRHMLDQTPSARRQSLIIVLAALVPTIFHTLHIGGLFPIPNFYPVPLGFAISSLIMLFGLHTYRLFEIRPIALRKIFNTLPEALIIVSKEKRVVDINPTACQLCQTTPNKAIGQPAARILAAWPVLAQIMQSSSPLEERTLPKMIQSASEEWFEFLPSQVRNDQGEIIGWTLLLHNITETKQLASKLTQLASVIEQAQETIVITNLEGTITYTNPYFETMTGYSIREALGKNPRILQSGQHLPTFYQKFWNTITNGKPWTGTFVNQRKDGSIYYEDSTVFPLKDDEQKIIGYAAVKRDITAQIQAEKALAAYAHRQTLLNEIIHTTIQQIDFAPMIQVLTDRMRELLDAKGCHITLWEQKSGPGIPSTKEDQNLLSIALNDPNRIKKMLDTGEPISLENIYSLIDANLSPETLANLPNEIGVIFPLIAHGDSLGAVVLTFDPDRKLTPEDTQIGMQAANQIALAIIKAQLLDQAEQRAREAETLRLAGATVAASLEQDETINRILDALSQVVPYDSGAVLLPNNQADAVTIVGVRGLDSEAIGDGFPLDENTPSKIVFDTRKPHIIADVQKHYKGFRRPPYDHIHGWMGIPLIVQNNIIGMLTLNSKQPGHFTNEHARLARAFANQVAIALENARLYEETRRLAIIDTLTQIYNRGHFIELAQREFDRTQRYHKHLSLIMLDVDHFKQVNDTYGHIVGDKTLKGVVQCCIENLRSVDVMGRYGGEEFIILLPETSITRQTPINGQPAEVIHPAKTVAERIRRACAQKTFEIDGYTFSATVSLGVAEYHDTDTNIENIIHRADQALLQAKSQGRNNVIVWEEKE